MAEDGANKESSSDTMGDLTPETEKQPLEAPSPPASTAKKSSLLKRLWAKTGLDTITIILMLKGGLPPAICIAAYQADAWAQHYSTLGYLSAIMSFISLAIQPQAKFLQTTLLSVIFICFGAALALLQIRCLTSAREHTTPATASHATVTGSSGGKEAVTYNASASVVAGCFLFAEIYLGNMIRAKRPALMIPTIQYSIIAIVSTSYAVTFPNMTVGMAFVKRMLEAMLTGIGIATGVSFFIIPMTSRRIAEKQMAGIMGLMKASINANSQYLETLAKSSKTQTNGHKTNAKKKAIAAGPDSNPEAAALRNLRNKIAEVFGKLNLEITFARKEIAWGYLSPHNYTEIVDLLREALLPMIGRTTFIDIMENMKEGKHRAMESGDTDEETMTAIERLEIEEWDEVVSLSHEQAMKMNTALIRGLTHISYQLKLVQKPKAANPDVEKSAGGLAGPGDEGFSVTLEDEIMSFARHQENVIQRWCDHKGIALPQSFWDDPSQHYSMKDLQNMPKTESAKQKHNQQQLYLILYIEYLTMSIGKAILKLSKYADARVSDGTMAKQRFVFPALRKIVKLLKAACAKEDSDGVDHFGEGPSSSIHLGSAFKSRKNPEHLPPANWFQKSTDFIRLIPAHFRSNEAEFGFRAAAATMSIAILDFIHQTQQFYLDQRVMWALIMVAISMSPNSGQGLFGFVCRVFGTLVAMVISIAIWYIGDQKPAAIIPLFYIPACLGIMFVVKKPQFAIVGILSVVTSILIIGYELQERKIGLKAATSNGQPYYKIYILAPYRFVTVVVGLAVCFIWTYFPYPITTRGTLRKEVGATMYLLANFYSIIHTTIDTRLHIGTSDIPGDQNKSLEKARRKTFTKCLVMLNQLREHSIFTKFDPSFGGAFPKAKYDKLIHSMQNMFNYMALMSYSTNTFLTEPEKEESQWVADFRHFAGDLNITSHEMTSMLCLTSFSITNSQPLPPNIHLPRPFGVAERMESIDPEILSVKHVNEPCYAAFAVLEVASTLIAEEMGNLVKGVEDLVGEVDFSFQTDSTVEDMKIATPNGKGKLA